MKSMLSNMNSSNTPHLVSLAAAGLFFSTGCGGDPGPSPIDGTTDHQDGGQEAAGGASSDESNGTAGFNQEITGGGTADGFELFELTIDGDGYFVQTNPWGGAEQTISAGDGSVFEVVEMTAPSGGESWDVASFPSVFRGTNYGGDQTPESGTPIAISEITSIQTGLSTNSSSIDYTGNATYDVYFTDSEAYSGEAPDTYLMVWFDANGINPINGEDEDWSCAGEAPTYIDSCSGAGSVEVDGKTFHRFVGSNGESPVISYVPDTRFDEWEFDLNDFVEDAVAEGVLTDQMYLQGVQGGFELIEGGAGLTISGFYAEVE